MIDPKPAREALVAGTLTGILQELQLGATEDVARYAEAISADLLRHAADPTMHAEVLAQARATLELQRLRATDATWAVVEGGLRVALGLLSGGILS